MGKTYIYINGKKVAQASNHSFQSYTSIEEPEGFTEIYFENIELLISEEEIKKTNQDCTPS